MTPAIQLDRISKVYRVDHLQPRRNGAYKTLREELGRAFSAPWRRLRRMMPNSAAHQGGAERFWALKDIAFDVQPGEVIGLIGRNGAGKSTLLKILSRITPPTSGKISINGRVGSLLEVGTGFHPELTGRENVFMNGSILGMSRREIRANFDEIVDFSGVEQFLDTPVKRYSSGMQVRLAFAVAAHLQPEILLVDEVLAVGDAAFQQKCLGKMAAVGQSGRTILFVSHNMAAVSALCQKGVVVNAGQIHTIAEVNDAIRSYLDLATGNNRGEVGKYVAPESGTGTRPRILRATVESELGNAEIGFPIGAPLTFRVTGESRERLRSPVVGIRIDNTFGQRVTTLHPSHRSSQEFPTSACGRFEFSCRVADLAVVPGEYFVTLALEGNGGRLETVENAMNFTVRLTDYFGTGAKPSPGIVVCREDWRLDQ